MGISILQIILPLALTIGVLPSSQGSSQHSIDVEIKSISLPLESQSNGDLRFLVETDLTADCYQLKPASVRVSYERNVILFHLEAAPISKRCQAAGERLSEIVEVGPLPKGHYEVRNLKDLKVWGNLGVSDQVSYAQIP